MLLLPTLIVLSALLVLPSGTALHPTGVCALPFCSCDPDNHPSWITVNCTVPHDQHLDIYEEDLPESTTDLVISGAEAVMFGVNSLSRLKDIRHLRVFDVNILLMRKFAAQNLNVVNIYLEFNGCDVLRIEERAFSSIKGPLSVNITDCETVSLDGPAFSWLLSLYIVNVAHLTVGPETFVLDSTAANVGEHGPGMLISFENLTVAEFPLQTFGSSASGIIMNSVQVGVIRTGAFSANTYNIVMAINSSFHEIEEQSFTKTSLINNLQLYGSKIHHIASNALQSGIAKLNISHCTFDNVDTGAINATVAIVAIQDSTFRKFKEKGFELSSWNKFFMERNLFDELPPNAIVAPGVSIHELIFAENEVETANVDSLTFIGQAYADSASNVLYANNYFGQTCHCNISTWFSKVLGMPKTDDFISTTYCTVDEFFARCFNEPDQNMVFEKFIEKVCTETSTIQCEPFKNQETTEIKNPRFPHKKEEEEGGLTSRNAKVIGIVIVTCFGCALLAMFISFVRWLRRKGYCLCLKNYMVTSDSPCGSFCGPLCICGCSRNNGLDNARSISQLSVNEYSERHRLNEPRVQEVVQDTSLAATYTEDAVPTDNKATQTLPEELTKELLENLKEKLEDPENYVEAREMIEHLYELIKVEESCNSSPVMGVAEENIYDMPFQNTVPRIGKNKKQMISVGTRTPSLDKLTPLSPYNRKTALVHEYFEPKDFAVHLYAEIANSEKERKNLLSSMPDVIAEQAFPRGPYLRAKMGSNASSSPSMKSPFSSPTSPQISSSKSPMSSFASTQSSPSKSVFTSSTTTQPHSTTSPFSSSSSPKLSTTLKSNKSTTSNSSNNMVNRPLPERPAAIEVAGGATKKHG